ncbi:hypothetical protein ISU07_10850 [Nocardioides islandensis]|jgi:hypothetical protein|uniref:Uncharacterized protein n=1 Tax=Nocardioides islandensis TaxID=433663 RepID=A0A930VFH3_9ACTN|nr:hypothetical protein [Nocardioides islandensis]MBF4763626.1 hypothetical protein [Nocardioides islandensis]
MREIARSALREEVVSALIDSGAINLEKAGTVFSKFAESALRTNEELTISVGPWNYLACGWPGPEIRGIELGLREG